MPERGIVEEHRNTLGLGLVVVFIAVICSFEVIPALRRKTCNRDDSSTHVGDRDHRLSTRCPRLLIWRKLHTNLTLEKFNTEVSYVKPARGSRVPSPSSFEQPPRPMTLQVHPVLGRLFTRLPRSCGHSTEVPLYQDPPCTLNWGYMSYSLNS